MVAWNTSGMEMFPMLVTGKLKSPRSLKRTKSLSIWYKASKKAWVTQQLFERYLHKLDCEFKLQTLKVLLFVDNCSAHKHVTNLEAIQLEFLLPNITSILQPMNRRVIRDLKVLYRSRLLSRGLLCLDSGKNYTVDFLSALSMLAYTWKAVISNTLCNCFC